MQAGIDWEEDLAYALELANELPLGPERDKALKKASDLRHEACMLGGTETWDLMSPRNHRY